MERELLLLGLLRQQEMHGYQLAEFITRDLASCTDLKKSTAYFLLGKMKANGWITEEVIEQNNRPDRHIYALTAQGEAMFQAFLRENLSTYNAARFADDIGLAFVDALEPAEARSLLLKRREAIADALAKADTVPIHSGSLNLVIEHQRRHFAAELSWLDEVLQRLDS